MSEENKDYYSKAIDEAKEREAFYQQIVEELRTEERYRDYFAQFSPDSVERFVSYYAAQKVNWYRYSSVHAWWEKRKNGKWFEIARSFLTFTQRIKVLHTIIRWANYEFSVPGIRSYHEFEKWLNNPFSCPYIQPVTPHEVETAVRFIRSLDSTERLKYLELRHMSIHSLVLIGDAELEPDEYDYPLFARYYDEEYGTACLRAKVPARVQKEYDYVWAYRNHLKAQEPPKEPAAASPKASLSYWKKEVMEKFIAACETGEYKRMYKTHRWWRNSHSFSEFVGREISDLSGSPQHLPVESNDDWREAIAGTAETYARSEVIACLPLAYNEYKEWCARGESFTGWIDRDEDRTQQPWFAKYLNELLEGRKLMNEPADFNF